MRLLALFLLIGVSTAAAAQLPRIEPGKRIRVETELPRAKVAGTVLSQTDDTLVVAYDNAGHGIESAAITRISASGGKSRSEGAWRGIKVGAVWGSAFALAIFGCAWAVSSGEVDQLPLLAAYVASGAVSGAFYGVIIGAVVGAEEWHPVYSRPATPRAAGLGLNLKF